MGNFNRDRMSSGGRSFGRRDFGDKDKGRGFDRGGYRPMCKAICSKCGKECEVPFKPTGSRPVFCKECFQNNRSSDPRNSSFENRDNGQINRPVAQPQYREQFEALNAKIDKILRLLEPKITTTVVSAETPKTPKAKGAAKRSTSAKKKQ